MGPVESRRGTLKQEGRSEEVNLVARGIAVATRIVIGRSIPFLDISCNAA